MALHPAWIAEIFHGLDFKNNGESDLAIISVAAKVSKTLRSNEVVARLGVITFAILIRDDATAAKILTARLLSILEASRDEFANNLIGSAFELMQLEVNVLCNSYKANTNLAQFLSSVNF